VIYIDTSSLLKLVLPDHLSVAVEDAIVLADELGKADSVEAALRAYRERRFERCAYIVNSSLAICRGQLGLAPPVDNHKATGEMFAVVAQPI